MASPGTWGYQNIIDILLAEKTLILNHLSMRDGLNLLSIHPSLCKILREFICDNCCVKFGSHIMDDIRSHHPKRFYFTSSGDCFPLKHINIYLEDHHNLMYMYEIIFDIIILVVLVLILHWLVIPFLKMCNVI